MPTVGIVKDWTKLDEVSRRGLPEYATLRAKHGTVTRSSDCDFSVELLLEGEAARFHKTHEQYVRSQLGRQVEFNKVEYDNYLEVTMPENRILFRWRDLGLVFADGDTPPPMHYALLLIDETSQYRIHRVRPITIRVFEDEKSAEIWARSFAASIATD